MKKILLLITVATAACTSLLATDGEYSFFKIAPNLRENANAVLRLEEIRFEVISTKETIFKNHYVITILNEKGDHWAEFSDYYDKHREIVSVEGILYDAAGKQLKRIKKKDTEDLSAVSNGSLMEDNRLRRHNFYYRVYPYTVEYTIEINNKSTLFFPPWTPQGSAGLAVETSTISIAAPVGYQVRHKQFNYTGTPAITEEKNIRTATWLVKNLPAIVKEPFAPMWHEYATMVIFGPTDFQMDDYKGNMATWQDYGKFVHALKTGKDQLPDNIKQAVHTIADGLVDARQKIISLYQYLQKNTRYISIQLGIGGWQPFDAKYVATKGYGDCKALTNYMYSILKEVGIPSSYAVIRAGRQENYITTDFPSQQFNHVVLCVPMPAQKDTMWLECTSQTVQAGYMGNFTGDRPALLIDENGGTIVHTPKYSFKDNLQLRHVKAMLDEEGTLRVAVNATYCGLQQDDLHGIINALSKDKVKELLHEQMDFSTYDINEFSYKQQQAFPPAIDEQLAITVSNYATVTGKRIFIVPNIMTKAGRKLGIDTARKYDVQLGYEYQDIDSVEIELPAGYAIEASPQPVKIESKFGNYASRVEFKNDKLYYYRSIEQNSGRYPSAAYNELVAFFEKIYKADRSRVVLVKN